LTVALAVEEAGEGPAIVLAHGLTATRRYVVHGSKMLERSGHRVIGYDARGHGDSEPAPEPSAYEYADLVGDLQRVLDERGVEEAVLVGVSMGAATTLAYSLRAPERVRALVQVTPAHLGGRESIDDQRWRALADGLEREGVEGFMRAYGDPPVDERFRGLILTAIRQRIERHRHSEAVAAALRVVPRSRAFGGEALEEVAVPTLVVASRDELDPEHPLAVAEEYARRIPHAEMVTEELGQSPLAWRGAQLSRAILGFLARN
jgi:pimeloyl-ACP methyl ester carboxylesterase